MPGSTELLTVVVVNDCRGHVV